MGDIQFLKPVLYMGVRNRLENRLEGSTGSIVTNPCQKLIKSIKGTGVHIFWAQRRYTT